MNRLIYIIIILKCRFFLSAVFPVGENLEAILLICRSWLRHENVVVGEFGAWSEDFRTAKRRIFGDIRVSDVPMPVASGIMVKTGMTSGFQVDSGVTRLLCLVGLQVAQGDRQHDSHAAGNALKHGGFAAEEVIVELKVAAHAYG